MIEPNILILRLHLKPPNTSQLKEKTKKKKKKKETTNKHQSKLRFTSQYARLFDYLTFQQYHNILFFKNKNKSQYSSYTLHSAVKNHKQNYHIITKHKIKKK